MSEQLGLVFYTNLSHLLSLLYQKLLCLRQIDENISDQHLQQEQGCRVVSCSSCQTHLTFVSSCWGSNNSCLSLDLE